MDEYESNNTSVNKDTTAPSLNHAPCVPIWAIPICIVGPILVGLIIAYSVARHKRTRTIKRQRTNNGMVTIGRRHNNNTSENSKNLIFNADAAGHNRIPIIEIAGPDVFTCEAGGMIDLCGTEVGKSPRPSGDYASLTNNASFGNTSVAKSPAKDGNQVEVGNGETSFQLALSSASPNDRMLSIGCRRESNRTETSMEFGSPNATYLSFSEKPRASHCSSG